MTTSARWLLVTVPLAAALVASLALGGDGAAHRPAADSTPAGNELSTSADGAAQAVVTLGSASMYAPASRQHTLENLIADDELRADLDRGFGQAGRSLGVDATGRTPLGELVARAMPAGTRVVAESGDRAIVEVWTLSVLGVAGTSSPTPVRETWSTEVLEMTHSATGWQVLSLSSRPGPTPLASDQLPSTPDDLASAARLLQPLRRPA